MKNSLDNIKVAIFDFDDTLAIHKDKEYIKHRNENEENLLNYFLKAYLNPEKFYEIIEPCDISESILKLINVLRKNKKMNEDVKSLSSTSINWELTTYGKL